MDHGFEPVLQNGSVFRGRCGCGDVRLPTYPGFYVALFKITIKINKQTQTQHTRIAIALINDQWRSVLVFCCSWRVYCNCISYYIAAVATFMLQSILKYSTRRDIVMWSVIQLCDMNYAIWSTIISILPAALSIFIMLCNDHHHAFRAATKDQGVYDFSIYFGRLRYFLS